MPSTLTQDAHDIDLLRAHLHRDQKRALIEATGRTGISSDIVSPACKVDRRLDWTPGKTSRIYRRLVEMGVMTKFCHGHYRLSARGIALRATLTAEPGSD